MNNGKKEYAIKSGEYDVIGNLQYTYLTNSKGVKKKIKRQMNKRFRKKFKQTLEKNNE